MDVLTAIKTRRSVRSYSSEPIPAAVMDRMRQALRCAPSACNLQPWHFILVTDAELRRKVAEAANGQLWMADAACTVVACGYPDQAYKSMAGEGNSVEIDVAIAVDHLTLAAVAEGLGTCWIGSFNEDAVKKLLGIARAAKVVALMPLGYPSLPALNHPLADSGRKPEAEIFTTKG